MCTMKKKQRVSSLELGIFVILIHLINAIQRTVCTGLSQQGGMTRPPWHSCFHLSPDTSARQGMGRHWKSFTAGEVAAGMTVGGGEWMIRMVLGWGHGGAEPSDAPQLPSGPAGSLMLCLNFSAPPGTNASVLCTKQQVLSQSGVWGRSWSASPGLRRHRSALWCQTVLLRDPQFPQLIDNHCSWHQETKKTQQWEGHRRWPKASPFLLY